MRDYRLTAAQFSALHTLCSGRNVPVWAALRAHLVDGVPLREAGLAAGVASDPATCYAQTYKARTRALRNLALAYAAAGVAPPAPPTARALTDPHQAALKSGRRVIQAHATQASKSPIQPRSPR